MKFASLNPLPRVKHAMGIKSAKDMPSPAGISKPKFAGAKAKNRAELIAGDFIAARNHSNISDGVAKMDFDNIANALKKTGESGENLDSGAKATLAYWITKLPAEEKTPFLDGLKKLADKQGSEATDLKKALDEIFARPYEHLNGLLEVKYADIKVKDEVEAQVTDVGQAFNGFRAELAKKLDTPDGENLSGADISDMANKYFESDAVTKGLQNMTKGGMGVQNNNDFVQNHITAIQQLSAIGRKSEETNYALGDIANKIGRRASKRRFKRMAGILGPSKIKTAATNTLRFATVGVVGGLFVVGVSEYGAEKHAEGYKEGRAAGIKISHQQGHGKDRSQERSIPISSTDEGEQIRRPKQDPIVSETAFDRQGNQLEVLLLGV